MDIRYYKCGKNLLSYISEQHLVITKAECGDTRTEGSLEELTGIQKSERYGSLSITIH